MRDPDAAAHALGKLLKYVGEDNVLWGTDSIWYGSPQDQIQAFRTFQISPTSSPTSTAIRGSRGPCARRCSGATRCAGLPGADGRAEEAPADATASRATAATIARSPIRRSLTYGPKTRREFLNLQAWGRAAGAIIGITRPRCKETR